MHARVTTCVLGFALLLVHGAAGQDLLQYRSFALGSSLAAVAKIAGVGPSGATTIHRRPAVLQELEWRPSRWIAGSASVSTDPVERIVFGFYDDRLYRIVVDYARDRTEGMTEADMVDALARLYGAVERLPAVLGAAAQVETEPGTAIARWLRDGHGVILYRTSSYREGFRLIVSDSGLDAAARKASTEARRLDQQEAPLREIARRKKDQEDDRAAADKARVINKGAFRP